MVVDGVFASAPAGDVVFRAATRIEAEATPRYRPPCAGGSCVASSGAAQALAMTRARCQHGNTAVDFRWTPRCASRPPTGRGWSDCCVTAPAAFALERLQQRDAEHLLYENTRPGPGGRGPQILTPLELIDRLAALVPPPRSIGTVITACWRQLAPVPRGDHPSGMAARTPYQGLRTRTPTPGTECVAVRAKSFVLPTQYAILGICTPCNSGFLYEVLDTLRLDPDRWPVPPLVSSSTL